MPITRRSFLRSALAAPFVVNAGFLMPVRALALPPPFLPGDLVNFAINTWREIGISKVCEPVRRIEGGVAVFGHAYPPHGEYRVPLKYLSLFHGLPGNRVNNPSMRHRLIRPAGQIGLAYPEDLSRTAPSATAQIDARTQQ